MPRKRQRDEDLFPRTVTCIMYTSRSVWTFSAMALIRAALSRCTAFVHTANLMRVGCKAKKCAYVSYVFPKSLVGYWYVLLIAIYQPLKN